MRKQANTKLLLNSCAQKTLLQDIYQRADIEACGLLTGTIDEQGNWHIEQAHPLPNIFQSPVYFEFAPEDLLAFELEHPEQIVGVYHSHPTGFPVASSTDRQNMKRVNLEQDIPWVWLIISGPFRAPDLHSAHLADHSIISYHHFTQDGLQQIPIVFAGTADAKPDETYQPQ